MSLTSAPPTQVVLRRPLIDNRPSSTFIPRIAKIETLGTSTEQRGHDFTKFLKSIHHHALTTFKNSKDISKAILDFTDPFAELRQTTLSLSQIRKNNGLNPMPPVVDENDAAKFIRESENADRRDEVKLLYSIHIKLKSESEEDLTQNLTILWATIMGQCTLALQEEVHGEPDYMSKSSTFDSIWLLQSLQKITAGVKKTTNKYHSVFKATKRFYSTQQSPTESIDEFYNRFENAKDLVGLFNAEIVDLTSLLANERKNNPSATKETAMQKFLAVAIIMNANKAKYEPLWNKLENDLLVGQDSYPKTIGDVTHLLTNWKANTATTIRPTPNPNNDHGRRITGETPAVNFAATEWAALVPLPTNNDFSALAGFDSTRPTLAPSRKPPHNISADIECIKCKKKGHYATACPFIIAPVLFQYCEFVRPSFQLNSHPLSLLNTIKQNKQFFSRREIEGAETAREQQGQIEWPSDQEYNEIIRDNLLKNSKATLHDLHRAEHIFGGPAVNLLKEKTVYKPVNTKSIEQVPLPPIILKTHPSEDLDVNSFYVQGAPYLFIYKSIKIKLHATQAFNHISKRNKKTTRTTYKRGPNDIINGIEKVLTVFRNSGFQVNLINADNEFKKLENKVTAHVEICAAGQHIPRIERGIQFMKDKTRCYWFPLPFKKVPKVMIDDCLTMVTNTMSPASIVLVGRGKIDGNNLKATFRRYYKVYCSTDNTKQNKERRTSAICLRPSNSQGGYYFMNFETGKMIHGYSSTELSMPQHIIDKVHEPLIHSLF